MWRIVLAVKVIVTIGLLAWLVSKVDPASLLQQLTRGDALLLLAGTAVLALSPLLGALRWRLILRRLGAALPTAGVVQWTYAGVFFNQVLPATVGGDGLRIWLASRAGAPLATVVNSVVLDRAAMVLSLVALVVASAPWFGALVPRPQLILLGALLLGGAAGGLAFVMAADAMPKSFLRWRLARWVASLSRDTRSLFLNLRSGPGIVLLSVASVINIMLSICLFALAFGARASGLEILVLLPPVIAASTLPISIGGWGTREVAMIAALGTIGIPAETAVLASVWLGLASIVTSLPGAFFHFFSPKATRPSRAELAHGADS
ncbi:MAG: flippase-like domain-containing protein [Burkholderiales bacterium]|nr:flippase-like domain-containing protein [Burkholderiales bacterium]